MLKIPNKIITPFLFAAFTFLSYFSAHASEVPRKPVELDLNQIHQKAKSGHPYYQCYLGIIYRTGYKNVVISHEKALYWTELAVKSSYPLALANLGAIRLWEIDMVTSEDEKMRKRLEALSLYEDAYFNGLERLANYGDPLAADLLADYYFLSPIPSPRKTEKYLKIAVSKGYPRSMAALGFYQITGVYPGIKQDKEEGIYHIERAAAQYLPEGLMNLATAYLNGDGVPKSRDKAILLYQEAARRGLTLAEQALTKVKNGDSNSSAPPRKPIVKPTPKPATTAFNTQKPKTPSPTPVQIINRPVPSKPLTSSGDTSSSWRTRALKGEAIAQRQVGLMYWLGKGVPKDLRKAKYWLEKAAEQGDELAQKRLKLLNKIL